MQLTRFPRNNAATDALCSPPIVLFNGWGMSSDSWQALVPELTALTEVIVLELGEVSDLQQLTQEVLDIIPERSVLLGWSLGGMLATHIALYHPARVTALVTLASNLQFVANSQWPWAMPKVTFDAFYQSYADNPPSTLKRFCRLISQGDQSLREQKHFLHSLISSQPEPSRKGGLTGLDLLASISHVNIIGQLACPALHLYGEQDQLVPVEAAKQIRECLGGDSRQRIEVLANYGHLLHYPSPRLAPLLVEFINEVAL